MGIRHHVLHLRYHLISLIDGSHGHFYPELGEIFLYELNIFELKCKRCDVFCDHYVEVSLIKNCFAFSHVFARMQLRRTWVQHAVDYVDMVYYSIFEATPRENTFIDI